jgi:tRNA threonylcarbamoyladenosine biosynthesis protein TsaB
LVGVSTLESVAAGAAARLRAGCPRVAETGPIYAVLDARRGEVFTSGWRARRDDLGLDRPAILHPRALAPARLASLIAAGDSPPLAIGDGAVEFREVLERAGAVIPDDGSALHRVSALEHCRLASSVRPSDPDLVAPEYIRLPDAQMALGGARSQ